MITATSGAAISPENQPLAVRCSACGRFTVFRHIELQVAQLAIRAVERQQLVVCALFHDLAVDDHKDAVGADPGRIRAGKVWGEWRWAPRPRKSTAPLWG